MTRVLDVAEFEKASASGSVSEDEMGGCFAYGGDMLEGRADAWMLEHRDVAPSCTGALDTLSDAEGPTLRYAQASHTPSGVSS